MMDDRFEPSGAPCRSSSHRLPERLSKNAAPAIGISAAKSADRDAHLNRAALRRQIQKPPLIAAVHSLGLVPAVGGPARPRRGPRLGGPGRTPPDSHHQLLSVCRLFFLKKNEDAKP